MSEITQSESAVNPTPTHRQTFESSSHCDKIFSALSKAQGMMSHAAKGSENPHFRRAYSDLADVWDAIREPFAENGLAVIQFPCEGLQAVKVKTLLAHTSGQWLSSTIELKPTKQDPQGVGSAITYGRRYGLMAMAGVAPDDEDDGNAASQRRGSSSAQNIPQRFAGPLPNATKDGLYRLPFTKQFKGMTLEEIGTDKVEELANWAAENMKDSDWKNEFLGQAADFLMADKKAQEEFMGKDPENPS